MLASGNILKMRAEYADPVNYFLPLSETELPMNDLIGKSISLKFTGQINCISCGKRTKTSFGQGFCYNCLQTAPEASETVMRPELSKAHLGIARDMDWAREHDLIDHFVYLAVSGELKVGVTRHHQVPTRWIDQGASEAIILARTPNRHISGVIEVYLKNFFSDKTNWRSMLQDKNVSNYNLQEEKVNAYQLLPAELQQYLHADNFIWQIRYPVSSFPEKVIIFSFDKDPVISGILKGIKGQYLIFMDGRVFNIRKHNGYRLEVSLND
ncbi:MAG TPA: DUF2797 domain-containing protein [Prolixibacteraceae bacterium]|nr:DUF2797 domain-containing protein [Prolixibacteraceae bacterium]